MADNLIIDAGFIPVQNAQQIGKGSSGTQAWLAFSNTDNAGTISDYKVAITYGIANIVTNPDNSIEFDFLGITNVVVTFNKYRDSNASIRYQMWLDQNNDGNLASVYDQSTNMGTSTKFGSKNYSAKNKNHYKIPPQQWLQIPQRRMLHWLATAQLANDEFYYTIGGGKGIFNNNPATYKPMAQRQQDQFKTLNVTTGFIMKHENGAWKPYQDELISSKDIANSGHNLVRLKDQWWQQYQQGN